jgi:anti-sigma factor RsiW
MSHEHEAVQLAIASLDFELTPAERTRMETGIAACPECAAIAAGHIDLARMLERLPVHEASPIVRQRVLRAALVPPRARPWPVLLVAAALFGLLLAAAAAVGAFRTDPFDPISDVPPVSPAPRGGVSSPEPSSSASLPAPASGLPAPPALVPDISDPTAGEQLLLGYVPRELLGDCVRSRTTPSDPAIQGDVAGIDCPVGDPDITETRYFLFASASQLRAWWQTSMKEMGLQPDSGGCLQGREGETPFDGGRLQCFTAAGGARLRWLDEERMLYGVIVSSTDEVLATVDWWTETHAIGGVRAEPSFTPVEQALVDEAPTDIVSDCIPYRIVGKEATEVEGSLASIDCAVDSSLIIDIGYFRFPSASPLVDWWAKRLPGLPVKADSGGCLDGTRGETRTSRGRIACYVSDGEARIRWTDEVRRIYGALNGRTTDLAGLFDWWDARH